MTTVPVQPTGSVPRHALRRGTRGFAAAVLFLTAMIVLTVALFVVPTAPIGRLAQSWLVPLAIAFGIAHLVATYGVLRRRAWVVALTLNLAATGVGVAAFGILLTLTGADPFSPTSTLPSDRAWADGLGLLAWLIGSWVVAARFVVRGMAPAVAQSDDERAVVAVGPAAPAPAPDLRRRTLRISGRGSAA